MSLNVEPKFIHPKRFQYDEDGARAWAAVIRYSVHKLNVSGKVNPKGGLVDIIMKDGTFRNIEFIDRQPNDDFDYLPISPKVWDGEAWVPADEYVCGRCCSWKHSHTPNQLAAGHLPETVIDTHHHGKFPPIQRWIAR